MTLQRNSCLALLLAMSSLGVKAAETDTARQWEQLLNASDPALQTEWGVRYEHGEGVPQDYERAVRLYCAAAEQGYASAQYHLGWLYANGRGGLRDDALAAAWFRLAAAQGNVQARNMLELIGDTDQEKPPLCLVSAETGAAWQSAIGPSPERRQIEEWVYRLAPHYALDPKLVLSVIEVESAFDSQALSPKNAQGLMQLIPATADRFGVADVMDPLQNLRGGMAYLRWLLAFFQGDVKLALAGYNAGEGAVERYQGIPPYPETQAYVVKVVQRYGRTTHPVEAGLGETSAMPIAMDITQTR